VADARADPSCCVDDAQPTPSDAPTTDRVSAPPYRHQIDLPAKTICENIQQPACSSFEEPPLGDGDSIISKAAESDIELHGLDTPAMSRQVSRAHDYTTQPERHAASSSNARPTDAMFASAIQDPTDHLKAVGSQQSMRTIPSNESALSIQSGRDQQQTDALEHEMMHSCLQQPEWAQAGQSDPDEELEAGQSSGGDVFFTRWIFHFHV